MNTLHTNITKYISKIENNKAIDLSNIDIEIKSLNSECLKLDSNLSNIHIKKSIYSKIDDLEVRKRDILKKKNVFLQGIKERMEHINKLNKRNKIEKHIILNSINEELYNHQCNTEVYVNKTLEICIICKSKLFKTCESMLTCKSCGNSRIILDHGIDFINDKYINGSNMLYNRSTLYRKYLMQFHENTQNPPDEVINKIYIHLSKVHMISKYKIRPTPITNILRKEKMQKWVPFANRIAKYMNGEFVVKLDSTLIKVLITRFNKITKVFSEYKMKDRKKIMNFEFLTKQFLLMENRSDLAQWFSCHKTKNVLNYADLNLRKCCDILTDTDDMNWESVRNI